MSFPQQNDRSAAVASLGAVIVVGVCVSILGGQRLFAWVASALH